MTKPLSLIRNRYLLILDLPLLGLAAIASFYLRLDGDGMQQHFQIMGVYALSAMILKLPIFYAFGLYRRFWRYAGVKDLLSIAFATLSGTALVTLWVYSVASLIFGFQAIPRSIPIIDWMLSMMFIGGMRLSIKVMARERIPWVDWNGKSHLNAKTDQEQRVLVMGAGDAGALMVREMQENPGLGKTPVGLLDDNESKKGLMIHGIPVRGTREDIPALVKNMQVDQVLIAMPTASGQAIRGVVEICRQVGVEFKTIPGIYELIDGSVSITQAREVGLEDLLRRAPVTIDKPGSLDYLNDNVVLVTGAGGSIGSELCRQIASCHPEKLLLLGHGENSIYHIQRELVEAYPALDVISFIADIRDRERLDVLFARYQPQVVFHAAAHKHVPLMEQNVAEAVANNVTGTHTLLQTSVAHDVSKFVLISTDKAVNPVNVMGCTKRLAELCVQDAAKRTGLSYAAVRFGNVLGSRGSVVPLFQAQIAEGGPVTVTHPEMERYFMTIPEAVQLVLQAGAMGKGEEIFVLDMGKQVRIAELARELIRLSGLKIGDDIEIEYTGIRPGEKLSEELFGEHENPHPTEHEKILVAQGNNQWSSQELSDHLEELRELVSAGSPSSIQHKLQEIIPTYRF